MTQTIPTIILIIAIIIFFGCCIISHHAAMQLGKAEGYFEIISKILGSYVANIHENLSNGNASSPLHEEVKKNEEAEIEKKQQSSREDNINNAQYSGVIHKFARDGIKKERPVMTYEYRGEKKFFEYNEKGQVVSINGKERENVLAALEGRKIRNYKKYDINMPEEPEKQEK